MVMLFLLSQVIINSRGLVYSVVLLLGSVALTVSYNTLNNILYKQVLNWNSETLCLLMFIYFGTAASYARKKYFA